MSIDELLIALTGTKTSFESTLVDLKKWFQPGLLVSFLIKLDSDTVLENSEREWRFNAVFSRATPTPSELQSLAEAGAGVSNSILRNSLAQLLPPEYRSIIFRPPLSAGSPPTTPTLVYEPEEVSHSTDIGTRAKGVDDQESLFSDVIVLSVGEDPATKKLLEEADFVPLRCPSVQLLNEMLLTNKEICAFLVEDSFLSSMSAEEQTAFIESIATYSTFTFIRFQESALHQGNVAVGRLIAKARCRVAGPEFTDVSFRESAGLQQRELESLKDARARLRDGGSNGLFIPGELATSELRLLGAAMSQYSRQRRFNYRAQLAQVKTQFLQGGHTGARVALVKVDDLRMPVIVKIDQKTNILDEARRFLTFIHKDNVDLHPEVHLHGDAALIVFGIIPGPDPEAEQPAPTLEQKLTMHWYSEMSDPTSPETEAELVEAFTSASKRLAALNRKSCFDQTFECKANPYLLSLKHMEAKGFSWGFSDAMIGKRERAEGILAQAAHKAICHGDAHTRNILVRREQGFLIDYAYSGPGHPCSDLVRLELSVYLTRFVQYGAEDELIRFQRDLSIGRLTVSELKARYVGAIRSRTNDLCMNMCVTARDLVLSVLEAHNLSWDHYLAVKLLTAWQALQVPSLQTALVRGVIVALSGEGVL